MIRTSSTIDGEILITHEIQSRKVFQEIQNVTPIDLTKNKPIHFSTEKLVKDSISNFKENSSFTSDDINNSENTRIIGSGPSEFTNDETISISSESKLADETDSSLSSSSTIMISNSMEDEDDLDENLISHDLIKEFLISHNNVYHFENEIFEIKDNLFLKSIETVETFNQIVYGLYSTEIEMNQIDFKKFLKSLLNPSLKDSYFIKTINQLIKVYIFSNQDLLNETSLFNLNVLYLVNHQLELSLKTIVSILYKIFNNFKNTGSDKSLLFSKYHNDLEIRLDSIENLNDLTIDEKLDLINSFIEAIVFRKPKVYRNKLDNIEVNLGKIARSLDRLNDRRNLFDFKFKNYNEFLLNNNDDCCNDNNFFVNIMDKINENNKLFIDLNSEYESLMRREPFSKVDVQDENFHIYFWHFECLKNSLMIEKRFKSENFDFIKNNFDFSIEKSEWVLITDLKIIKTIMTVISSHTFDSNFVNGILKVLEKSYVNSIDIEPENYTINLETEILDKNNNDQLFLTLLNDFKQRLIESNFIHSELIFSNVDHSVQDFTICESFHNFNQIMQNLYNNHFDKNEKLKLFIELVQNLYSMINRKYVNFKFITNHLPTWHVLLANSKSLEQIKLSVFLLDNNIYWEKTKIGEICKLCNSDKNSEDYESKLKVQCKNCPITYHLNCLLQANSNHDQLIDENNNQRQIKMFKSKMMLLCYSCEIKAEEEYRIANELNQNKFHESAKQLSSIEVNNYSLRFNKTRATNLDKKLQQLERLEKRKERKNMKNFIASSTDEARSTDSEFVPIKKTRGRKKVLITDSSESNSDAGGYKRTTRSSNKKRKNDDDLESDGSFEPKVKIIELNDAEIDERRARLGLRIRPKKPQRMF